MIWLAVSLAAVVIVELVAATRMRRRIRSDREIIRWMSRTIEAQNRLARERDGREPFDIDRPWLVP